MTVPRIFVNQVGYLTDGPKGATVRCDAKTPLRWHLLSESSSGAAVHTDTGTFSVGGFNEPPHDAPTELRVFDNVVADGESTPRGFDPTAGFAVHTVDFSDVRVPGQYQLEIHCDGGPGGPHTGRVPVTIGDDIYDDVLRDALRMFTLQRSGVEITADVAGPQYARAAGHVDVFPNRGDGAVHPLPAGAASTADGVDLYDGWTGDYAVDGRGGWYDAGDCGKYVVNGGIAVAQLLSIVERSLIDGKSLDPGTPAAIALEEALWELDWMRRMQVPPGQPYAGMLHHKLADEHWTAIPTLPADDPERRFVHRPSTAATLNLAAVAAQGARVLFNAGLENSALADELLAAARTAYTAAKEHPNLLAPDTNVLVNPGSGPYNDDDLLDEWYWAQGCLFLSTGEQQYLDDLRANPYHVGGSRSPWSEVGFDWRDVAGWARMQLGLNPLPARALMRYRTSLRNDIREAADALIAKNEPFGQLYSPADARYAWGSNGMIANNAAIAAVAYYESGEERYRDAALAGLDYLFGRNALGISYVTGYGDNYVKNQHSRWYAAQKNAALPHPPPGSLSGGPNSACPDPVSAPLAGQPAQLCFIDDIDSWGTNEMTINWNAALAWLLAFAASS